MTAPEPIHGDSNQSVKRQKRSFLPQKKLDPDRRRHRIMTVLMISSALFQSLVTKHHMKPKGCAIILILFSLAASTANISQAFSQQKALFKKGDYFPENPLDQPAAAKQASYLGIERGKLFTVKDIKADLTR